MNEGLIKFRKVVRKLVALNKEPKFFPPSHLVSFLFSFIDSANASTTSLVFTE